MKDRGEQRKIIRGRERLRIKEQHRWQRFCANVNNYPRLKSTSPSPSCLNSPIKPFPRNVFLPWILCGLDHVLSWLNRVSVNSRLRSTPKNEQPFSPPISRLFCHSILVETHTRARTHTSVSIAFNVPSLSLVFSKAIFLGNPIF